MQEKVQKHHQGSAAEVNVNLIKTVFQFTGNIGDKEEHIKWPYREAIHKSRMWIILYRQIIQFLQ